MITLLSAALSGLLLGTSLIIAIGAQNAFILRMGLAGHHVFVLCLVCALADALLIVAGIAGMGAFVQANPGLLYYVTLGGVLFLFGYAILSLRRMLLPETLKPAETQPPPLWTALAQCLTFTFLNPHVYLDTVVLVGAYSTAYEGTARHAFGAGAAAGSFIWFFGLGYGARLLQPVFARPVAWRILDACIAAIMAGLGLALLAQLP